MKFSLILMRFSQMMMKRILHEWQIVRHLFFSNYENPIIDQRHDMEKLTPEQFNALIKQHPPLEFRQRWAFNAAGLAYIKVAGSCVPEALRMAFDAYLSVMREEMIEVLMGYMGEGSIPESVAQRYASECAGKLLCIFEVQKQ